MLVIYVILALVANFTHVVISDTVLSKADLLHSLGNVPEAENTLIFAHVVFRHGERTPTPDSTYPNDPHRYASYWPTGVSHLTKTGLLQTYKLGLELRQRYNTFLGSTYYPDLLGALSSPKTRCQTTLQSVLSAMFQPNKEEQFLSDLPWRPIAYDILPADKDDTFALYECDNYWNITNNSKNKTILDLYDYLSEHTGVKVLNNSFVFLMHDAIAVTSRMGKPQLDWVQKIYPEPITSAWALTYYDLVAQRLQLGASGLYRRIVTDTLNKLNGTMSPPRRKMMLYSGHEQTIVYALGAIKAYAGQVPKMAAYLAIELHYINQTFGIKVFLQNYDQPQPKAIDILNQGEFCPLDVFLAGTNWLTQGPKPFCR